MDQSSLSEKLIDMAAQPDTRSQAARLREVYPAVAHALGRGVPRKAVLAALHADGFTMSLKMFDKELYRIRKKGKGPSTAKAVKPVPAKATHVSKGQPPPKHVSKADMKAIGDEIDNMDLDALVSGAAKKTNV